MPRKQWAENLGILKNTSWVLDYRRVELVIYWEPVQLSFTEGSRVGYLTGASPVGSWLWPCRELRLRSWSLTMEFCRSLPTAILKTMRCAKHLSFVSTEGLRIVSLSPRVEEPNLEVKKLINIRTWTTESPVYLSPPVFLHMYNVCDWYGYTTMLKM